MRRESNVRTASFACVRTTLFACALALACLTVARAQDRGATLSGRVTDAQGAALPGATVTLYARSRTQLRLSATADAQGAYRFERLAPGAYLVEAAARGFAPSAARVAVLGGSGASLYGTNASGGVVNVVTDEGGGPFHGQLFAEGGGLGFLRARAQVAGSAGAAERVVYSAGVSHLNVSRGVDGDDAARSTNGQGRVLFRLTPTATLSARVYASDAFAQLNEEPQGVGTVPATGIIDARPVSRAELPRFESGASLSQLNLAGA